LLAVLMDSCSGSPMQFLSGVDRGPFGLGDQEQSPSRCKLLRSKAVVVSVAVKVRTSSPASEIEGGERKRTAAEASKAD
jgi:hypothetical protein